MGSSLFMSVSPEVIESGRRGLVFSYSGRELPFSGSSDDSEGDLFILLLCSEVVFEAESKESDIRCVAAFRCISNILSCCE